MTFDLTRHNLVNTAILLVILFAIFEARWLFGVEYPVGLTLPPAANGVSNAINPLSELLNRINTLPPILSQLLKFALVFFNGFFITRIGIKNMIYTERTYMPSIIYMIVSLGIIQSGQVTLMLFVGLIHISIVNRLFNSFRRGDSIGEYFNAGALLSFSIILYPPTLILFVLLIASLKIFSRGWRELVSACVGTFLPIFLCSYISWAMGNRFLSFAISIWDYIKTDLGVVPELNLADPTGVGLLGMIVLVLLVTVVLSIVMFYKKFRNTRKKQRRFFLLFILFLVLIISMMFMPCHRIEMIAYTAIPLAIIIPGYFRGANNNFNNVLYTLIICSVIAYNVYSF